MTYLAQAALAHDPDFLARVEVAALGTCKDVYDEGSNVTNHVRRAELATEVARNPLQFIDRFAEVLVSYNLTIAAASPDQTIKDGIAALWNLFAGA